MEFSLYNVVVKSAYDKANMKSKKYSKQILKYLINGRPNKVKRYIKRKEIQFNDFMFKDGDSLLHKISFYGHLSIIKHYTKDKSLLMKPNSSNGKLPCHQAVLGAMHRIKDSEDHLSSFKTISFLQQASPISFTKLDDFGVSADFLFKVYKKQSKIHRKPHTKPKYNKMKYDDTDKDETDDSNEDEKDDSNDDEKDDEYAEDTAMEERWNAKIQREFHFDLETNQDSYLNSFSDNLEPDTWNKWAEGISEEYHKKHLPFSQSHYFSKTQSSKKCSQKSKNSSSHNYYPRISPERIDTFNERLHNNIQKEEERSASIARLAYEKKCESFFRNIKVSDTVVSYADIPWPFPVGGGVGDVKKFLFRDLKSGELQGLAKKNQVHWHPDRFMHRCAGKICMRDEDVVMDTVKQLSQLFNGILNDYEPTEDL